MIRLLEPADIQMLHSFTEINLNDIDYENSAVDINSNGVVKSIILTKKKPLISVFRNNKFPKRLYSEMAFYHEDNNHQIVFLYKADRNGTSIGNTLFFLIEMYGQRGTHWWWIDKNDFDSDKAFNKICIYLFDIKNTPYYYKI